MVKNKSKTETPYFKTPDFGKTMPLRKKDKEVISLFQDEYEKLSDNKKKVTFRNIIQSDRSCGFAGSGRIDNILNTDPKHRYRVTVRTTWRNYLHSGQYDEVVKMEAGERKILGCTCTGMIPTTNYSRQIVGESDLGPCC